MRRTSGAFLSLVDQFARMHSRAMTARCPAIADLPFEHSWGGIMAFTLNNGKVFGNFGPNLYAVLTNDVSPMTRGEIVGSLSAEHIEGVDSDLPELQHQSQKRAGCHRAPCLMYGVSIRRGYLRAVAGKDF